MNQQEFQKLFQQTINEAYEEIERAVIKSINKRKELSDMLKGTPSEEQKKETK